MYEPMLAHPTDVDDIEAKRSKYWMELKLDGVRCVASKVDGVVKLTTRGGKDMTDKLPHIVEQVKKFDTQDRDFVIDGELGYTYTTDGSYGRGMRASLPIIDFNATMRVIGSGVDEAIRKQSVHNERATGLTRWIQFHVFDMLYYADGDLLDQPFADRRELLETTYSTAGLDDPPLDDIWLTACWDKGFDDDVYVQYVKAGGEGVMLKDPGSVYHPGKRRANTWYKLKKFDTIDVVITGSIPGKGKYTNLIGAITFVEPTSGRTGKCSGMSDSARVMFTELASNNIDTTGQLDSMYKGKWMEIRHFGLVGREEEGYRHPQFVRLRPDKD